MLCLFVSALVSAAAAARVDNDQTSGAGIVAPVVSNHTSRRLKGDKVYGRRQGDKAALQDYILPKKYEGIHPAAMELIGNTYFPKNAPIIVQSNVRVKILAPEQGRVMVDCLDWIDDILTERKIEYAAAYGNNKMAF